MEKFKHKNLTKRTSILFKIEHLIHLTKKGKKINIDFFFVFKFSYVHDKKFDI